MRADQRRSTLGAVLHSRIAQLAVLAAATALLAPVSALARAELGSETHVGVSGEVAALDVGARELASLEQHLGNFDEGCELVSENSFDDNGNRLSVKDPEGAITTFGYDAVGRLTSVRDAEGKVSRTEYDAEGRVTATVDARGSRATRKYDAAGRLVETVDASGAVTSTFYCSDVPTPCSEVDALGNVTTREFDDVGRLTRQLDALGRESTTAYDTGGRVKEELGPGRPATTYSYQAGTGLLASVTTPALIVSYQYDNRGNRRQVTAGTQVTTYTFDLANRLLTETNPLLKTTTYTYDAAGNRRTKLDANGHTTTYSYDDNRRLTRVDFDDGTAYEYAFDTRGNRTLEKGPSHERHLHYDALNRLDVVDDVTFGKQLTYSYDANGNRASVSEGGVSHLYEYDARNMLAAARVGAGSRTLFGYDAMGRRSFVARPNGVRTDYSYDDASQLLSMVHAKGGNVLLGFAYGYDGRGNRVSKTREDGTAEVYGYDSSLRLTRVDYGATKTVAYSLDGLGNRTLETQTVSGPTGSPVTTNFVGGFNAFNQQLTRSRSGGGLPAVNTTFAYDDNGNTLSESTVSPAATTTYSWDRDNRLRTVTPPSPATPTSYSYDANGLRVQRVDANGTVRYLLDDASVLAELDGANAVTTRYLNNPQRIDEVISFERGGATYWPLTDALGSIYAVADSSGAVVHRFDFDVYGARADLGGTGPVLDIGFTGRWHDPDGLIEHRDRQRRPDVGAWLQADREGTVDGPNIYAYVKNAPTVFSDPSGQGSLLVSGVSPMFNFEIWQMLRNTLIGVDLFMTIQSSDLNVTIIESLSKSAPGPGSSVAHFIATTGEQAGYGCESSTFHTAKYRWLNIIISSTALSFWNSGGTVGSGFWKKKHSLGEIAAHELGHVVGYITFGIDRYLNGSDSQKDALTKATFPAACMAGREYRKEFGLAGVDHNEVSPGECL